MLRTRTVVPPGARDLPRRPRKPPQLGRRINVHVNHFAVTVDAARGDVFQYDVDVAPSSSARGEEQEKEEAEEAKAEEMTAPPRRRPPRELPAALRRRVLRAALASAPEFQSVMAVSDWQRNVFTNVRLGTDAFVVRGVAPVGESGGRRGTFDVAVQFAAAKRVAQLDELFAGRLNVTPDDVLQALDVALRHTASLRYEAVGRSLFPMVGGGGGNGSGTRDLGGGVECVTGYFQSLRPTQSRLTLNVDRAYAAFYREQPLIACCEAILGVRELRAPLTRAQTTALTTALRNVRVDATHRATRATYRVNAVTIQSAEQQTFDESGTTVAGYFATTYGPLRHGALPCVHVGAPKRQVYLPLEVCVVSPRQRRAGRLSETQTAAMITHACVPPAQRKREIDGVLQRDARSPADPVLPAFGLRIDPRMLAAPARVLPAPTLRLGGGRTAEAVNGVWRLDPRRHAVFAPATLTAWAVVDFSAQDPRARLDRRKLDEFAGAVARMLERIGVRVQAARPQSVVVGGGGGRGGGGGGRGQGRGRGGGGGGRGRATATTTTALALLEQAAAEVRARVGAGPQVIVCVVPAKDALLYGEIKRAGDVALGIPTQCCLARHAAQARDAYVGNLVLKVHAKLGGVNFTLGEPPSPRFFDVGAAPTLVCGADVSHPGPGEAPGRPSLAALVGNVDAYPAAHTGVYRAQPGGTEEMVDLEGMMTELLRRYYRQTRRKPTRVLYFRDGVSESQFDMVAGREVAAIKAAYRALEGRGDGEVTVSAIVVQKRHHTRLFPQHRERDGDGSRVGNVPAGTVVDAVVCHPRDFDFFLVSHAGLQGTSRPCHYHVVYDDHALGADELEALAFRLCFLFVRCTRAVSMVPAVVYAHLLAFRARFFVDDDDGSVAAPHPALAARAQVMYFV